MGKPVTLKFRADKALVGSQADTQQTIDYLQVRGCIERIEWSQAIALPENGILIRRDPGNVLRYLQRDRQFA